MRDVTFKEFGSAVHFKRLTPEHIKEAGSFNVVDGAGQFIGIFVVPLSDAKKSQIQSICEMMNQAIGK